MSTLDFELGREAVDEVTRQALGRGCICGTGQARRAVARPDAAGHEEAMPREDALGTYTPMASPGEITLRVHGHADWWCAVQCQLLDRGVPVLDADRPRLTRWMVAMTAERMLFRHLCDALGAPPSSTAETAWAWRRCRTDPALADPWRSSLFPAWPNGLAAEAALPLCFSAGAGWTDATFVEMLAGVFGPEVPPERLLELADRALAGSRWLRWRVVP
jgi:hypothetical protein